MVALQMQKKVYLSNKLFGQANELDGAAFSPSSDHRRSQLINVVHG